MTVLQIASRLDDGVAAWLQAHAAPALSATADVISRLHRPQPMLLYTLVVCAVLASRRRLESMWLVLVAVIGGTSINDALKHAVRRPRPGPAANGGPTDFAFPSGHVATATLLYGAVAFVSAQRAPARTKAAAVALAAVAVGVVAASRLVLGAHHFTDVLAAALLGVGWLCTSAWLVRRLAADGSREGEHAL